MSQFLTAVLISALTILGQPMAEAAQAKSRSTKAPAASHKVTSAPKKTAKTVAKKTVKKPKRKKPVRTQPQQEEILHARFDSSQIEDMRLSESRVPVVIDPFEGDRVPASQEDDAFVSMKIKKAPAKKAKKSASRRR